MSFASDLVKFPPFIEAIEPNMGQHNLELTRLVIQGALHVPFPHREDVLTRAQSVYRIEPDVLDFAKSSLVLRGVIRIQDEKVVHGEAFLSREPNEIVSMGNSLLKLV